MGYYTVLTPCVVGQLHYATVPVQPIEADDAIAAALVASGALAEYRPGGPDADPVPTVADIEPVEPVAEPEPPRPRRRRSHGEG